MKYSNEQRVAIALAALGTEQSAALLRNLPRELALRVLRCLKGLGRIDDSDVQEVSTQLLNLIKKLAQESGSFTLQKQKILQGLSTQFPEPVASGVQEQMEIEHLVNSVQQSIAQLSPDLVAKFLSKEQPQVGATILALAHTQCAVRILPFVEQDLRSVLALAISKMAHIDCHSLAILDSELKKLVANVGSSTKLLGLDKLTKSLQHMDELLRTQILEGIAARNAALASQLSLSLVSFEKLIELDTKHLAALLSQVSNEDLSGALTGAAEPTVSAMLLAVSQGRRCEIEELINSRRNLSSAKISQAKMRIIEKACFLKDQGKILFPWLEKLV